MRIEHRAEALSIVLQEEVETAAVAGVVHEHVDLAMLSEHLGDCALYAVVRCDVELHRAGAISGLAQARYFRR
jgi:hypothetical protein